MELNGFAALHIIYKAVFQVTGNSGPDSSATSFMKIVKAPLGDLSQTTVQDFHDTMGIQLLNFTAGDPDVWTEDQLNTLWETILDFTQQYWQMSRTDPFHRAAFIAPADYGSDNTLAHLSVQVAICWGV